jgi:site-specific DNA-methyltransferase (adenine-specific)
VRLVTKSGDTVLDPFAGSGTTGAAALLTQRNAILVERDAESVADIERRLKSYRHNFITGDIVDGHAGP